MTTINSEAVERAVEDAIIASPWFDIDREGVRQSGLATTICTNIAALTAPTTTSEGICEKHDSREAGCKVCDGLDYEPPQTPADDVVERSIAIPLMQIRHVLRSVENGDDQREAGIPAAIRVIDALLEDDASQQARIAALWGLADEALDMVHELSETQNYSVSRYVELRALLNQEPSK